MPLTQIDPVAALIVIDMQKGIVGLVPEETARDMTERVARLAAAFRAKSLPVVLVNVAGRPAGRTDAAINFSPPADWTELVPALNAHPSDTRVTKLQLGAFYGTALEQTLRRRAATQVFLCGISTSIGVESTARTAYDHGYNVVTVADAMTDRSTEAHTYAVKNIFPRISEVTTTDDVIAKLAS